MDRVVPDIKPAPLLAAVAVVLSIASVTPVDAADKPSFRYEDDEVMMRLVLRSTEQLNAFYLGREFPQKAIDRIVHTCLIAAIVHNKAIDVLWLELDNWEFSIDGKPVARIKRDYWQQQWSEVGLKQAHQSTFGWTLLPEVRDLRKDEGAGGGVAIAARQGPFTMTAKFNTGHDKSGQQKTIVFKGVSCPGDL